MSSIRLTYATVPAMVKKGWGRIVYITSVSVKQPIPFILLSNTARAGLAGARCAETLRAGGFGVAPAHMNHYAWTQTGAVIQINLIGPFALTYVNPADDPSKAAAK